MIEPYTKGDYAYFQLKSDIIQGKLAPGQKLNIIDLANWYHCSAMPIRSALARLEQDGLVESTPHVGACVTHVSLNDYFSIMLLRMEAEALATRLTAMDPSSDLINTLEGLLEAMFRCNKNHDSVSYSTLNRQFHSEVYRDCKNPIVIQQINTLTDRTKISINTFDALPTTTAESAYEHTAWLNAIKNRKVERSISIIRYHRCRSCLAMLELIKQSFEGQEGCSVFSSSLLQGTTPENVQHFQGIFKDILEQNSFGPSQPLELIESD